MHFTSLLLAAAASSLAVAQSSDPLPSTTVSAPSSGFTCQAQQILDTCVSQRQPQVSACPGNDYSCFCQQYAALLTCYDNCPGDPGRFGVSQQQSQNCAAASAYGTTTLMVATSSSSGSTRSTSTGASSEASDSATTTTDTRSGSAASATGTGAAVALDVQVTGGILGLVAACFGLFL